MPSLRGLLRVACIFAVQFIFLIASTIRMEPSLIVLPFGRLSREKPVMPDQHHLDVLKSHVRAVPIVRIIRRRCKALRRAGRFEGMVGRKVRLAEKCGFVPCFRERAGEAFFSDFRAQIDAVVMYAMRAAKLASQD